MAVTKNEILNVAKQLYPENHSEIVSLWADILNENDDFNHIRHHSISLTALYLIIESVELSNFKAKIELLNKHKDSVKNFLKPYIDNDFKYNKDNKQLIEELINNELLLVGSSLLYHRIREAIGMKLFEIEDNVPTYKIKDGNKTHVAKILPDIDEGMVLNNGEISQWEVLMTQAITSMDDYTADTFDIISIMWMNKAKAPNDMIRFSHEDVLHLRQLEKNKSGSGNETYQKKQRVEVMRRLAAIASIWISVTDDEDIEIVEKLDKNKDFKISKYRRLFQVDNVTFAHDRKTNEAIGIYECDIKPTELLAKYLFGTKRTTSFLSLKALQYNPVQQKYHKRLTRYLSWQWKIRSRKEEFEKPFNIGGEKGLLKTIGLELDRPIRTKETFEKVLDKLRDDQVIEDWHYVEIDESKISGRGWYDNYWLKLKVVIKIPEDLKREFTSPEQEALDYNKIAEFGKILNSDENNIIDYIPIQLELDIDKKEEINKREEIELSPELVESIRKERGLSLNKAAKEIGIAHTTLSRFEKGLIKKPNSKNDEKIKLWLLGTS